MTLMFKDFLKIITFYWLFEHMGGCLKWFWTLLVLALCALIL